MLCHVCGGTGRISRDEYGNGPFDCYECDGCGDVCAECGNAMPHCNCPDDDEEPMPDEWSY